MQREAELRVKEIEKSSQEEARKGLDAETRKIVADNRRMGEELRFQLQTTDELQQQQKRIAADNKRLSRDAVLSEEKQALYAKQGQSHQRQIMELKAKIKSLERSLSQVVREFEREREFHPR